MDLLQIVKANKEEKEVLQNLMQFYFYDFSEFMDSDVKEDGLYGKYPYLDDYWMDENRFPYLLKLEGKNVGFVLVRYIESEDKEPYFSIAEFFIMKKYRRLGLGKKAAIQMFDTHKGLWEVFQVEKNVPAQIFWMHVINEYTSGRFTDRIEQGERRQEFSTRSPYS
ncbi:MULTISPECIES: GNAT family N-acetyltransferase [unclassified Paenibacillus]|uniref:GNAT family N-acetyltransferase n=1 Tax=unclassified Paenibacillus TaxID=185978 RepID=UPI00364130F3